MLILKSVNRFLCCFSHLSFKHPGFLPQLHPHLLWNIRLNAFTFSMTIHCRLQKQLRRNIILIVSPGDPVVKIRCSHHPEPRFVSWSGNHISCLSYCGGCLLLWCWKLCHQYFKHQQGHPWWTGFNGAFRLRQTRKKVLITHFWKNWPGKSYE